MNIFEYFDEEERDIEAKLEALNANYEIWTREQVFDKVKEVCDAIMGHLKKQNALLLNNIKGVPALAGMLADAQKDHLKVQDEIGQLVEVHVDEPGYDEYLKNLLVVLEEHIEFSKRLYENIDKSVNPQDLDNLNAQFNNLILHSTDFNALQSPPSV